MLKIIGFCLNAAICFLLFLSPLFADEEVFYGLGKAEIEMRLVKNIAEKVQNKKNWIELSGLNNQKFLVSKELLIDSKDVEGIALQQVTYVDRIVQFDNQKPVLERSKKSYKTKYYPKGKVIKETKGIELAIYFKPSSWAKVKNIAKENINKKVAIIKNNTIITTPVLCTTLDRIAGGIPIEDKDIAWVAADLEKKEKPSDLLKEKQYLKWVAKRVRSMPNDFETLEYLAFRYYKSEKRYSEAISLFKKLLNRDPDNPRYGLALSECYLRINNSQQTIEMANNFISKQPSNEYLFRIILANAYIVEKKFDFAIKEYKNSLEIVQKMWMPESMKEEIIMRLEQELKALER